MSIYNGQTYRVPGDRGGWFPNPNVDVLPAESMSDTNNINLHNGGRETRGGTTKVNTTVITGAPRIMGLFQFRKKNGTEFIITATADGKIQKDYATVLKTGLALNKLTTFEVFKDILYICNGSDIPQTWDGVAGTTSDLPLAKRPSDWTGTNHPVRMIKHGRGVSEALWAFGVPSQLQRIYASQTGTDDFSDLNVTTIDIETGDGFGIVGMEEFGDRLIPIGKRRAYLVDDVDANRANWGYDAAQWDGGLASIRLLTKTPNDLIAMSEDGEIYSVIRTQVTGDFRSASIARPAFIHTWIRDNVDLSKISDFHMIYDQTIRAIKIFVIRKGQTKANVALVYFIDRPPQEAWVKHTYPIPDFLSSSAVVRVAAGNVKIYAGGHTGFVYELESDTLTDDLTYYESSFLTINDSFGNPRVSKRYDRDWIVVKTQGGEQIGINVFVDGRAIIGSGFKLIDGLGNFVVDEAFNNIISEPGTAWTIVPLGGNQLINESNPLGLIGIRKQTEIKQLVTGKKMFISQLLSDHVVVGPVSH